MIFLCSRRGSATKSGCMIFQSGNPSRRGEVSAVRRGFFRSADVGAAAPFVKARVGPLSDPEARADPGFRRGAPLGGWWWLGCGSRTARRATPTLGERRALPRQGGGGTRRRRSAALQGNKKPARIAPAPVFGEGVYYAAAGVAACAALRRFRKTYPPMPARRSSEAATWPGSGTAAAAADTKVGFVMSPAERIPAPG